MLLLDVSKHRNLISRRPIGRVDDQHIGSSFDKAIHSVLGFTASVDSGSAQQLALGVVGGHRVVTGLEIRRLKGKEPGYWEMIRP